MLYTYISRGIIDGALDVQKRYTCVLLTAAKAFDRMQHYEIIMKVTQLKVDGKDLRVIKIRKRQQQCE